MKRLLLSAYACEPGRGSEPAVGWNTALGLSDFFEVWVLTRSNNRELIEKELLDDPKPNLHFVYYDLPKSLSWWKRGGRGVQLYYYLWQIGIYKVARQLCRTVKFDAIYHVTFVNFYKPSFLAMLPIPFIWGPVGGGESAPKVFRKGFSFYGLLYEYFREMVRWLGEKDPFVLLTARKSVMALATTEETLIHLRKIGCRNVKVISQVGLPNTEIKKLSMISLPGKPIRFISIGRLLNWKGFHLGIKAFADAGLTEAEYWIIGDGPERTRLERLAQNLGVGGRVRFWGALSRTMTLEKLGECHVLIHPSLHDSGGWVVSESLASGRPVICLDLGGPAMQVNDVTGYVISAITPEQVVKDISEAILSLAQDESLLLKMGEEARRRANEEFCWDEKCRVMMKYVNTCTEKIV